MPISNKPPTLSLALRSFSAGERCMAISVAVPLGERTADELLDILVPKVRALKVGPGIDPDAEMGQFVSEQHRERVQRYVEQGVNEGAELVVDGRTFKMQGYERGYFFGASVFDRVRPEMTIYKEEIFGPVLSVLL